MRRSLLFALLLVSSSSCGDLDWTAEGRGLQSTGGESTVSTTRIFDPLLLDLLIVVDDALPSGPRAAVLEQALREAARYVTEPRNGVQQGIDVNVALVPATYGSASPSPPLWPTDPACPQPSGPFLHASQLCDSPSNFAGGLSDTFACAVRAIGPSGGSPRPLDAVHAVMAASGGFRREQASLAILLVSGSDDPTLETPADVARQHDYLTGLVANQRDRLSVGIVAPAAAQGLMGLADSLASELFSDIESGRWTALPWAIDNFTFIEWWPACISDPLLDADPNADGLQPDCVCTESRLSTPEPTKTTIPRCPDSGTAAGPCWKIEHDDLHCEQSGLEFTVVGWRPECMPSYAVRYSLTCAVDRPGQPLGQP